LGIGDDERCGGRLSEVQLAYDGLTFEVETEARAVEVQTRVDASVLVQVRSGRKHLEMKNKRGLNAEFAEEGAEKSGPAFATKNALGGGS